MIDRQIEKENQGLYRNKEEFRKKNNKKFLYFNLKEFLFYNLMCKNV